MQSCFFSPHGCSELKIKNCRRCLQCLHLDYLCFTVTRGEDGYELCAEKEFLEQKSSSSSKLVKWLKTASQNKLCCFVFRRDVAIQRWHRKKQTQFEKGLNRSDDS